MSIRYEHNAIADRTHMLLLNSLSWTISTWRPMKMGTNCCYLNGYVFSTA